MTTAPQGDGSGSETAGSGDGGAGETPKTPSYLTEEKFQAWSTQFASKVNAELRDRRLSGKSDEKKVESGAGATPVTQDDLRLTREVGRLESKAESILDAAALAELNDSCEGQSLDVQARLYRTAIRIRESSGATPSSSGSGSGETPGSRGVTPDATRATRADASASRTPEPRPQTQAEFRDLRKKNPDAANRLLRDTTFNLQDLPLGNLR